MIDGFEYDFNEDGSVTLVRNGEIINSNNNQTLIMYPDRSVII